MHADDAGRARRNAPFDVMRVERMGYRINIAKDRRDALPLQRMGSRCKGERRHNHFALQIQRANCNLQTNGRVAHRDAVFDADQPGNTPLEFAQVTPVVSQPTALKYVADEFQQPCFVAQIRTPDKKLLTKSRRSAKYRQSPEPVTGGSYHFDLSVKYSRQPGFAQVFVMAQARRGSNPLATRPAPLNSENP